MEEVVNIIEDKWKELKKKDKAIIFYRMKKMYK